MDERLSEESAPAGDLEGMRAHRGLLIGAGATATGLVALASCLLLLGPALGLVSWGFGFGSHGASQVRLASPAAARHAVGAPLTRSPAQAGAAFVALTPGGGLAARLVPFVAGRADLPASGDRATLLRRSRRSEAPQPPGAGATGGPAVTTPAAATDRPVASAPSPAPSPARDVPSAFVPDAPATSTGKKTSRVGSALTGPTAPTSATATSAGGEHRDRKAPRHGHRGQGNAGRADDRTPGHRKHEGRRDRSGGTSPAGPPAPASAPAAGQEPDQSGARGHADDRGQPRPRGQPRSLGRPRAPRRRRARGRPRALGQPGRATPRRPALWRSARRGEPAQGWQRCPC